jgi:hypothetical protein
VLNGRSIAALLLLLSACGTSPETTQLREAVAATGAANRGSAVAFRIPTRRGATVALYRLPGLDDLSWRFDSPGLVAEHVVGYAPDADAVLMLAPGHSLLSLELGTGRARTADSGVTFAAIGPTGAVVVTHQDQTADVLEARRLLPLARVPKGDTIAGVWGTTGGRGLVAVTESAGPALYLASGGALGERHALPSDRIAVAPWGDVVAVATDTAVTVFDPLRANRPRRLKLGGAPLAVAFSASGHRLFVATDAPDIEAFGRFDLTRVGTIAVPTPVMALRADQFGEALLGRTDDGVLVASQGNDDTARVVPGDWRDDLPAVAPDGTLLVARGGDVVALSSGGDKQVGRVRDGARDRWLIVPWDARRPALQLATPQAAGPVPAAAGQQIYLQVSSTSNAQWAEGLAQDLRTAGMRASVLAPTTADEMYRVVIGPYASRDEAETIGRTLGMPYWIFTRDSAGGQP